MNIKQLFLPLVGALALIGCNNEALEPTSSNTTQANSVTLALSLEGTADASEMRAVSFDANQNVPPTTHDQYSDWTTHCFLRNADGSKKAYAVINWDATLEGGKVKLKMRGHELQLLPIGSSSAELSPENKPVAGERWSIVGITGGGKLNEDRTRVDFAPDADLDNNLQPHQARVPFTFEKAYFTVSAASGERAPQIRVHFKPQGSLLNIYLNNKKARKSQFVAADLLLVSTALSNNGYYDYSTGEAKWIFRNPVAQDEVISRAVTVNQDSDVHYLLWGMPRPESVKPTGGFKSKISLGDYNIYAEGTTDEPRMHNEIFVNGLSYSTGIDIDRSLNPLSRLTTTDDLNHFVKFMSSTANDFINPTTYDDLVSINNSGIFYNITDAKKYFGLNSPENQSDYYLPTIQELATIFTPPVEGRKESTSYRYDGSGLPSTPVTEFVQFSKDTAPVKITSEYRNAGGEKTILYALRFYNLNGISGNNEKRTAFRYEWTKLKDIQNNVENNGIPVEFFALKVTTRYLGNYGDADNYYTEDYWNNSLKKEQNVTITIPALGLKDRFVDIGSNGYFLSVTPHGNLITRAYMNRHLIDGYNYARGDRAFTMILFPKN